MLIPCMCVLSIVFSFDPQFVRNVILNTKWNRPAKLEVAGLPTFLISASLKLSYLTEVIAMCYNDKDVAKTSSVEYCCV